MFTGSNLLVPIGAAVCSGKTRRTRVIAPVVLPYSTRFNPSHARSTCMLPFARLHILTRSLHSLSIRFSLLICAVALCGGILRYPRRVTPACPETVPTTMAEPEKKDMKNAFADKGEVRTGHMVSAAAL